MQPERADMRKPRIPTRKRLKERLVEAEAALDASIEALRSHGHQGITWQLYAADAARVRELKGWIAGYNHAGSHHV